MPFAIHWHLLSQALFSEYLPTLFSGRSSCQGRGERQTRLGGGLSQNQIKRGRTVVRHVPLEDVVRVRTLMLDPSEKRCSSQQRVHHLGGASYRQFVRSPFCHQVLPSALSYRRLLGPFTIKIKTWQNGCQEVTWDRWMRYENLEISLSASLAGQRLGLLMRAMTLSSRVLLPRCFLRGCFTLALPWCWSCCTCLFSLILHGFSIRLR